MQEWPALRGFVPRLARGGWAAAPQCFGNHLLAASLKQELLRRFRQMHAEHADRTRLNELSGAIIGGAFTVLNTLCAGFLEKVYENALALEMRNTMRPKD
jgi:hypothetical protein